MSETPGGDRTSDAGGTSATPARTRMAAALREIRREGYKVAAIYAVVDAALVTMVVNLALQVVAVGGLPATVRPPDAVAALPFVGRTLAATPVATATLLGLLAGLLTFVGEFAYRVRNPLIDQFEAANPSVREALRTARDVVQNGRETVMAVALYEDVLDRLRDTSSVRLVDTRRLVAAVLLLVVLSVVNIHVAVVDLELVLDGEGIDGTVDGPTQQREYEGLRDGDAILGAAEDVSAGDTELEADLPTQGGGETGNGSQAAAYDQSGFTDATVDSQQAGFAQDEQIEDAELIRDYNLQIRDIEEDDS
jgi:hypothetical protein